MASGLAILTTTAFDETEKFSFTADDQLSEMVFGSSTYSPIPAKHSVVRKSTSDECDEMNAVKLKSIRVGKDVNTSHSKCY